MSDVSVLWIFDDVRAKTMKLLDVDPTMALWSPVGTDNHILWHAGHIFVVVERLVSGTLDNTPNPPALPDGWGNLFGWESRPEQRGRNEWPAFSEVTDALRTQHTRLRPTLERLTETQLSTQIKEMSVRRIILHAIHDEACHSGEIWLLRKLHKADQANRGKRETSES